MKKPLKRFLGLFIAEKPNFSRFEKFKFSLSKYCYLLPTGCATSKAMAEHCFHSFDGDRKEVVKFDTYLVTYAYDFFFLWFRLHVRFKHDTWVKGQFMQKYDPRDKSKTTIEEFLNS